MALGHDDVSMALPQKDGKKTLKKLGKKPDQEADGDVLEGPTRPGGPTLHSCPWCSYSGSAAQVRGHVLGAHAQGNAGSEDDGGELPEPGAIVRQADLESRLLASILRRIGTADKLTSRYMDQGGPDWRDAKIRELEQKQAAMESERRFAELRQDFESKITAVASPPKENGHASSKLEEILVAKLADRIFQEKDPGAQLEQLAKFSSMLDSRAEALGKMNEHSVRAAELGLREKMWETQQGREAAREQAALQAQEAEAKRSEAQFGKLTELAQTAIKDAFQPIATTIGDGLRDRIAGRGVPPGSASPAPTVPQLSTMTPEQRVAFFAQLPAADRATLESNATRVAGWLAEIRVAKQKIGEPVAPLPTEAEGSP